MYDVNDRPRHRPPKLNHVIAHDDPMASGCGSHTLVKPRENVDGTDKPSFFHPEKTAA